MSDDSLRHVKIEAIIGRPFTLQTWYTGRQAPTGQELLRYEFRGPDGAVIFEGRDYGCSPCHAIDSDASLRELIGFLTLRPGDTDDEYFKDYTGAQRDFCATDAEALSVYADEEPTDGPEPFEEVEDA